MRENKAKALNVVNAMVRGNLGFEYLLVIHLAHHHWLNVGKVIHVVAKEAGHRRLSYLCQLQ